MMVREGYRQRLEELHTELIRMGALCEEAISRAVDGLFTSAPGLREHVSQLERDIDLKEREIESMCVRLLIREQPVAGDLRRITAAQRMIGDMERIGDQALDIAELALRVSGAAAARDGHIADMAKAAAQMLTDSVDSFVAGDIEAARAVIAYDDVVDGLFSKIRGELIDLISAGAADAARCLDLLMIIKYLERIGDHASNIAEWVIYSMTGARDA